ncbi:hypothetical protein FQA47_022822 [Oryzias melastigma]|uniref:Uncharacterized protein n=1 Tax=Oryzias melastigma TaxID=30732 RepID=A0A834CD80_ORYME|nr:hypothetical protein FQA47_022822 [Oryzias melastigma]
MTRCWALGPKERPSFTDIVHVLGELPSDSKCLHPFTPCSAPEPVKNAPPPPALTENPASFGDGRSSDQ